MSPQKLIAPLAGVVVVTAAYVLYDWHGVALAATALVTWVLWQLSRFMKVMRTAANRPMGQVGSATALQARLRTGMPLLEVITFAKSLGKPLTPEGQQPEEFAWTDDGQTQLRCVFQDGKLLRWKREQLQGESAGPPADPASASQ